MQSATGKPKNGIATIDLIRSAAPDQLQSLTLDTSVDALLPPADSMGLKGLPLGMDRFDVPVDPSLGPIRRIVPEEEGFRDKAERAIASLLGDDRRAFRQAEKALTAAEVLPGIGDVAAGADLADAYRSGDTVGMAIGALGLLPLVGGTAKKLGDELRVSLNFDRGLIPDSARGHGTPQDLLVKGLGEKPATPVVQKFTPQNRLKVFQNLEQVEKNNPEALKSVGNWLQMENEAFGGEFLPAPPLEAINYSNSPELLAEKLQKLTPELKRGVDEGFGYVQNMRQVYNSGAATPDLTGRLMLWGILSRGAGPAQQEAAFLDVLDVAKPFIDKAVAGNFTAADLKRWEKTAKQFLPEGSPAKSVTMNVNAAGRLLQALSQRTGPGNQTALGRLHDLMSDPQVKGRQFRREFFQLTDSPGIDNKVVSFIGLVGGKDDMLVMDRIQSRHLWDDGRYGGKNLYDGFVNKTGLVNILSGPRGLLVTESMEDGLSDSVQKAYEMIGRPQDASIGRMHWETWVIDGNQAVSHSTLESVRRGTPIGGGVREGKPGTFSSGSTYRMAANGPIFEIPLSDGDRVLMTPESNQKYLATLRASGQRDGILPRGFKVTQAKDRPWYELPGVDRRKVDELAKQFADANPDGSLRSGAPRAIPGGDTVSKRRGDFLRGLRSDRASGIFPGRPDGRDPRKSSGAYTRGVRSTDEGIRLLALNPNPDVVSQFEYAGLNAPAVFEIDARKNAKAYNERMVSSLAGNSTAAQVEIKSPEELSGMRLFQTPTGSGFAIKQDGDIVAVYASPTEPQRGSFAMLEAAVEAGGRKLDAFNTYLPNIYETVGFRPVSKVAWSDEFAPPGWDKDVFKDYNQGEPDVVFFVYDPDYVGKNGALDLPYSADYDAAVAVQDLEMRKISPRVEQVLSGDASSKMRYGGAVGGLGQLRMHGAPIPRTSGIGRLL